MAFTAFRTWVTSEVITAALLNAQIRDNGLILKTSIADDGTLAGLLFSRSTADVSVTSSTTLADVSGLSFALAASEIWTFIILLHYVGHTSGDMKLGLTVPSGATGRYGIQGGQGGSPGNLDDAIGSDIAAATVTGTDYAGMVQGTIVNSTTAGTVQLQMAQQTSNGTATTIYANSSIVAVKVG